MHDIGLEEIEAVKQVIENKQFMRYRGGEGGFTENFEKDLCEKMGVKHALTLNSGTSSLIAALAALGIGPGDEVIVPAYTWVATALAPMAVGAVPVIAEINETLTIDPEDIRKKITPYTKAIIPVHMRNLPCDMDAIMKIADENNLKVVEDTCQAVGGSYKGKRLGTMGHAGAFSFNMYKNMTCGEGGALLTNDSKVYERALIYHDTGAYTRSHASEINEPFFAGLNLRVSEIQGALLGVQLKRLDGFLDGLKERTNIVRSIISSSNLTVSPHNDPDNAISISLVFDTEKAAAEAEEKYKLSRLINTGRHIYTNWEPVMKKLSFHEKMNPFKWANREISYSADMCPTTLDILKRTVTIDFAFDKPVEELKQQLAKLV